MAEPKKKIGAALVVGGGIGGMQTALDLAEAGIKVYLVDSKASIGGVMAQLDKTFPTNDCAMCTMAPRLVEIGRHKDIEIITLADLEKIEGLPGNFAVTLTKRARYIDEGKCTGCGDCSNACPIVLSDEYNMGLAESKAVYRLYPQAVPNKFAIKKKGWAPCRFSCPIGQRAQGYIALIGDKRYLDAYRVIRRENPFPSICGRVCVHHCEDACTRGRADAPVSIRYLKRFVADWVYGGGLHLKDVMPFEKIFPKKVAVIGSGPAGLTCAFDLVSKGFPATVFEAADRAGGTMALSIPDFRLPKDIVEKEIEVIKRSGVEVRTNSPVADLARLKNEYDAVCIATGCMESQKLGVKGENLKGVMGGLDFLRKVKLGQEVAVGSKVAVIGGGNVAMDASRTALRCGAKEVAILYRRSREEMPASREEVEEAEEEGVRIQFLTAPVKIIGKDGEVSALECLKMQLGPPDSSGRRRPAPVKGSEFKEEFDTVISATGQIVDGSLFRDVIEMTGIGTVRVNPETFETTMAGVFAIGDAVSGPSTIVEAIASGHKAALMIEKFLMREEMKPAREEALQAELSDEEVEERVTVREKRRQPARVHIKLEEVRSNFKETVCAFTEEEALAEARRCLECGICCECLMCQEACKAGAIDHSMRPESRVKLEVGAIVLTPGYEIFDANLKKELGYDRFPNVITSLEFERILSASGPFSGKILRPSDKGHPKKIAFIQCVGSRDTERNYCSSVCCMYATKEAIMTKEHQPDMECHIFYIDLRAFGKGFDEYYDRARKTGIKYTRCRPSGIKEVPETRNLLFQYQAEDGKLVSEEFDLVVLSIGMRPPAEIKKLRDLGIELNKFGFVQCPAFSPVATSMEGVFSAGTVNGPKDIPESVMEGSAAASNVLGLLSTERGSLIAVREFPPEFDVKGQEPRIGMFVCHCGTNIAGVVNIQEVVDYCKTLPGVVYAENNLYTCSNDTQKIIQEKIKEHKLNRVVVASCTPRTHEPLFRNTVREAGLNPYLFEMANIRDQCSWVHMSEPEKATLKAKDLVRMAGVKVAMDEPLEKKKMPVMSGALVIGGGLSGLVASLNLADAGFDVYLVEKEKQLGGNLRKIHFTLDGFNPGKYLEKLVEKVRKSSRIQVLTSHRIEKIDGSIGNFKTKVAGTSGGGERELEHGIVIVATGAAEYRPEEYDYGSDPRVMTQMELEEKLCNGVSGAGGLKSVVMIQCIGSRDEKRQYCSRICCIHAIKNALKIKEMNPDAQIYILYRDVRAYGFSESHYRLAREKGVIFLRYEEDRKPVLKKADGRMKVSVEDPILKVKLELDADTLVLSAGVVPNSDNKELAQLLKVPLNQNGFFLEAHMKLRPVEFATEGVFLCGLAHSPKTLEESIAQASASASKAAGVLAKKHLELEATISTVIDENCDGCAYCIDPCPFKALTLFEYMREGSVKKTVEVNESLCKGCGTCMATCPKKGIYVKNFRLEQLSSMVAAALQPPA